MGNHSLRKDMTCLNCGHVVEKRYCPNCGQENKETKESFHFLFTHTIEDIVHYDSSFWKTIKHLLFYPAKLTKEYLAGKRKTYVPPVKLYIFISFITFFIISILPNTNFSHSESNDKNKIDISLIEKDNNKDEFKNLTIYKSINQYDSIQNSLPEEKKDSKIGKYLVHKAIHASKNYTKKEFLDKYLKIIFSSIPKILFLIMPVFAFIMWFFHNKKKWYYFDHGIFTLHYFSMILLSFTIFSLIEWFFSLLPYDFSSLLSILTFTLLFWWIFYFYRSHSKMFNETKFISRLKASVILLLNIIIITFISAMAMIVLALNVK